MMKTLIFNEDEYTGVKIIKTDNSITVLDENDKSVFVAKGISDFSLFTLGEGQVFDTVEQAPEETLAKEVANIKIDNMKKDVMMTNSLKIIADLRVEVMNLKGAQ